MTTPMLQKSESAISALETEKRTTDEAFKRARDDFEKSSADPTDAESDAFKAFDDAGKARDSVMKRLDDARKQHGRLAELLGGSGGDHGGGSSPASDNPAKQFDPSMFVGQLGAQRDYGKQLVEGDDYKELRKNDAFNSAADLGKVRLAKELHTRDELKALVGSSTIEGGDLIQPQRGPLVTVNQRPLTILQLISKGTIDSTSIKYPTETVIHRNAAWIKDPTTAEAIGSGTPAVTPVAAGLKPETSIEFGTDEETVKTLAVYLPAHRNALEDVAWLRSHINMRLGGQLDQFLEDQVFAGDGTGENFTGIIERNGIGHPAATGNIADRIHKAITTIRLAYENPTAVALHPNDWELLRLLRDASGADANTGQYLYGPPALAGTPSIWGLPVAISPTVTPGTAVIGDWAQAVLWMHTGLRLFATDSHADFFRRNLIAILAELRAAFGVYKPQAFAVVELY